MSDSITDQIERSAAGVLMGAFALDDDEVPEDIRGIVGKRAEEIKRDVLDGFVDIHGRAVTSSER